MAQYRVVADMLNTARTGEGQSKLPELPEDRGDRAIIRTLMWLLINSDSPIRNIHGQAHCTSAGQALEYHLRESLTPEQWTQLQGSAGEPPNPEGGGEQTGFSVTKRAMEAIASVQATDNLSSTELRRNWQDAWNEHRRGNTPLPNDKLATDAVIHTLGMRFEAGGVELEVDGVNWVREKLAQAAQAENHPGPEEKALAKEMAVHIAREYVERVNHDLRAGAETPIYDSELEEAGRDQVRATLEYARRAAEIVVMMNTDTERRTLLWTIRTSAEAGRTLAETMMKTALQEAPESRYAAGSEDDEPERLRRRLRLLRACRAGTETGMDVMEKSMDEAHQGIQNLRMARAAASTGNTRIPDRESAAWEAAIAMGAVKDEVMEFLNSTTHAAQREFTEFTREGLKTGGLK